MQDADSAQRVFTIPDKSLIQAAERIFFIDLSLTDAGGHVVSHNFYWVPGTLTTFDWEKTDYTHTPAARHEDLTALAHSAAGTSRRTRRDRKHMRTAARFSCILTTAPMRWRFRFTRQCERASGGLIAPVFWSDNWIELTPGESTTLTAHTAGRRDDYTHRADRRLECHAGLAHPDQPQSQHA